MKLYKKILTFLILITLNNVAYAQTSVSAMFANGTASFESMIKLLTTTCYVLGAFLVISAIFKFAQMSDPQKGISPKTPIVMFLVGVVLYAFTPALNIVAQTMSMGSGSGSFLMPGAAVNGTVTATMKGVLTFIKLIGYIAFIRGWLMYNKAASAQGGGNDGLFFRGTTHILGGIAAINVVWTARILANTFAPGMPLASLGL